jgi:transcriptional regulator with PAS, ATPase and Fis domain
MQVKLLRVLQEKKFTPIGSNREIDMDVRLIAATNRNLEEMIKQGTFREDLFYRLNVIPIYLPPLRERKDDISKLVSHFISKFNYLHKKRIVEVTPQAMEVLIHYNWPGNIRELENVIEHAFVIEMSDKITPSSLPIYLREPRSTTGPANIAPTSTAPTSTTLSSITDQSQALDYRSFKEQFEKDFIIRALKTFRGRINQTAMHAKIPKKTLLRKLQKYNIRAEDYRT